LNKILTSLGNNHVCSRGICNLDTFLLQKSL